VQVEAHATRAHGARSNSFILSANLIGPQHNAENIRSSVSLAPARKRWSSLARRKKQRSI